nr:hypothetical protein [Klebsiella pneumoniae subsp. pneumoniae]
MFSNQLFVKYDHAHAVAFPDLRTFTSWASAPTVIFSREEDLVGGWSGRLGQCAVTGRNQTFVFQQHFASLYQHVVIDIVFAHDGRASIPGRHCIADITAADIIVLERQGCPAPPATL